MPDDINIIQAGQDKEPPALTRSMIANMAWCLGLSLFWVVFLWRFWEKEIYALGANASVFFIGLLWLFLRPLFSRNKYQKHDLYWIAPLILISASYSFYDNPFIKAVNLPVLLSLAALFLNYGILKDREKRYWGMDFISGFVQRFFSFFGQAGTALKHYAGLLSPKGKSGQGTVRKAVLGVILLLAISLIVVIPLLSSADPEFGGKLAFIYDLIRRYIAESVMAKTAFFLVFALFLYSCFLAWTKEFDYPKGNDDGRQVDSIVAGIVLGGILLLYALFLWVQIERLWVGSLPFEFRETEALVKSGFWQLFFLTALNTLLYFFTYKKTSQTVQTILKVFTAASILLLLSAAQRVALYAVNYGLSYEKFFAAYTVIYCAILFAWLFICLFRKKRANILKFSIFLFAWMYALITVMPMEQFILRSNITLSKRPQSRIRLYELTMLSPDVLGLVKKTKKEGLLKDDWQPWIDRQEKRLAEKRWYEFNF